MPEKNIQLRISQKLAIYGRFNGASRHKLFITIHGLPGGTTDGLHEDACRWFAQQGFATFRCNLYGWQKDARQLIDCTLKIHATDLDTIVRHFRRQGFKKIFVAGHSFGGPTILLSRDQGFDAVALWDPSYDISFAKKKYGYPGGRYLKVLDGYFMRWGANLVIGKAMAKEVDGLDWDGLTESFHKPIKIIAAGKGILVPGAKRYSEKANAPKNLTIIKGATHYFDDKPNTRQQLFRISKRWFDKF